MLLRVPRRHASRRSEQGYMLIVLVLAMALLAIAVATAITSITFNIRRDREEELIHRGAQYARAIRAYYKKFGRYPASIENLQNTNQLRFLRKKYKDPITHKDFRLLHFGEVKMAMMGGGVIAGATTLNANGTLTNPANPTQNGNQTSDSNSGTDSQNTSGDSSNNSGNQSSSGPSGQTFGGLPIVGVASTSKETSIREFDKKKKYSEWQFAYDPSLDRGMLISTPYQPQQLFGIAPQNVNGLQQQNPTPGLGAGAPGAPAPPTNPVSPTGPPLGNPSQPTDTPNQQ